MMKLQAIKSFSLKKSQTSLQNSPLVLLIKTILLILPVIIILVCYYHTLGTPLHFLQDYFNSSTAIKNNNNYPILVNDVKRKCDIFKGEWVQNMEAPYYTNTTCWAIHEHQNCIKYGRPDTEFMKWKWKPKGCELPVFEPIEFLEIVRGKSLAFVGDSVGRNHKQSLICLFSRVEYPIDVSPTRDERFKHWWYRTYNFTMATFWSPHLVKAEEADTNGPTNTGLFNLYLDEIDETWSTQIEKFDYVIISAGHWFFRPSMYFQNHKIIGCLYCLKPNVTDLPLHDGYKLAFRTGGVTGAVAHAYIGAQSGTPASIPGYTAHGGTSYDGSGYDPQYTAARPVYDVHGVGYAYNMQQGAGYDAATFAGYAHAANFDTSGVASKAATGHHVQAASANNAAYGPASANNAAYRPASANNTAYGSAAGAVPPVPMTQGANPTRR